MELIVENGTTEVKASEHEGNVEMEKVRIPASVVRIGASAFKDCINLKEVTFEDGPEALEIGESAFEGCKSLREINLPGRASRFLRACFRNSGLERLTIGPDGDFIASQVPEKFAGCSAERSLSETLEEERLKRLQRMTGRRGRALLPALGDTLAYEITDEKRAKFEKFWEEFAASWGVEGEVEEVKLRRGRHVYTLRCGWNEDLVIVGMLSPWVCEWDYVQMYRGMFGWGDVGCGFCNKEPRNKVVGLLLDEIIRRNKWMESHPAAYSARDRAVDEECEKDSALKPWFAEYRWTRNHVEAPEEGDLRLYVPGSSRIWGCRLYCEWELDEMRMKHMAKEECVEKEPVKLMTVEEFFNLPDSEDGE